jgi:hypothetical protein
VTRDRRARRSARKPKSRPPQRRGKRAATRHLTRGSIEIQEIESIRAEVERLGAAARAKGLSAEAHRAKAGPPRWNANPDDVRRSVVKLVLTLVEFIRQLLERQAIRRVEAATLSAEETEAIGVALMRLEETIHDLGAQFGIPPEELNLDLGPIGKLV